MKKHLILLGFLCVMPFLFWSCEGDHSSKTTKRKARRTRKARPPFEIIRNDDCFTCHSIYDKTIGPSYIQVARKYENNPETVNRLAEKIIEGGGGLWGGALMSKHPLLKKRDVKKVVHWILNLENPKATEFIRQPGYRLEEFLATEEQAGLKAEIYLNDDLPQPLRSKFPKIDSSISPTYSLSLPEIHFKDSASFFPMRGKFFMRIRGKIEIPSTGTYIFRLEKSGPAELKIDGLSTISSRPEDQEINLHIEKGLHELMIHFIGKNANDTLSLQWISLQEEYFRVVPARVFPSELPP